MMWKTLIFVLIVIIGPKVISQFYNLGYHRTVYKQHPGHCFQVKGTENGSEDVELVQDGIAIISSGLWYPTFKFTAVHQNRKKGLLLFDLDKPEDGASFLKILGDFDSTTLNPHGISVYKDDDGNLFVYVVSHDQEESVVFKFALDIPSRTATYLRTFGSGHPSFHLLNDLVVVGKDQFYYTNYLSDRRLSSVEEWLQLHWGSIGYFDGTTSKIVVTNLLKPNGITATKNGKKVFVANSRYRNILVYTRTENNELKLDKEIDVQTNIDNVNIAESHSGIRLYVGSLPVRYKAGNYFKDPTHNTVPAHVLQVNIDGNGDSEVMQLFSDDGNLVSASSSALVYKSKLLVGSVLTNAAFCDMAQIPEDD